MNEILKFIYTKDWAIQSDALTAMVELVSRNIKSVDPKLFHGNADTLTQISELRKAQKENPDYSAVMAIKGDYVEGSYSLRIRGNTAIIPMYGVLVPRAGFFARISGATSCEMIAHDLQMALKDSRVKNIVCAIDSPGGEITGVSELSQMIYNARTEKKIVSFVSGYGASALYWIASATSEIILPDTASVGSIGVVAMIQDTSERDKKAGIQNFEIVSSVSPNKRLNPKEETGQNKILERVNALADIFVSTVAKHRDVSTETVLTDFGQGSMLLAEEAIKAGMADRIDTFENLITSLNQNHSTTSGGRYMSIKDATIDQIKAENPTVFNAITALGKDSVDVASIESAAKDKGFKEGAEAERERIQGIESLETADTSTIIKENKFNPDATKESVAIAIIEQQGQKEKVVKQNIENDANNIEDIQSSNSDNTESDERAAAKNNIVKGMNSRRERGRTPVGTHQMG